VDADPDVLPRTDNFGLNYMAFVELCDEDTVPEFLRLAFNCCIVS
ncbi:jg25819, partial [Pararge aegeria aegeria]